MITTEYILSYAFGVETNQSKTPTAKFGKLLCKSSISPYSGGALSNQRYLCGQKISIAQLKLFSAQGCDEFIEQEFAYVLRKREKSGEKRKDLIDSMLEIKRAKVVTSTNEKGVLVFGEDILTAQAGVFFTAR